MLGRDAAAAQPLSRRLSIATPGRAGVVRKTTILGGLALPVHLGVAVVIGDADEDVSTLAGHTCAREGQDCPHRPTEPHASRLAWRRETLSMADVGSAPWDCRRSEPVGRIRSMLFGSGGRGVAHVLGAAATMLLPVGISGCLSQDPNHCANRAGDQTCSELGAGAYCSICAAAAAGCVDDVPDDACYRPLAEGEDTSSTEASGETESGATSEATTSSTTTMTTTTAETETATETEPPAPDCMSEGPDPSCPEALPFCADGVCSSCDGLGEAFCGDLDSETPACHPDWGQCQVCVAAADCSNGNCDDNFACVGCIEHEDCGSGACDLKRATCLPSTNEFWVDADGCDPPGEPSDDPGFGTISNPYCWIATALDNVAASDSGIVHLIGQDPIEQSIGLTGRDGRTVVFLAGDDGAVIRGVAEGLAVANQSIAYLDNVSLVDNEVGVHCNFSSEVWLEDLDVADNVTGISGDVCRRLVVRRTVLRGNTGDTIALANDSKLRLESSFVLRNGSSGGDSVALRVVASEFDVVATTFAFSQSDEPFATMACSQSSSGTVRNSVMVSPNLPSIDCGSGVFENSVVDTDVGGKGNVVVEEYDTGWFVDLTNYDGRVAGPGSSPFAGVARWELGDPRRDIDGEPRLAYPGLSEFAGADQP